MRSTLFRSSLFVFSLMFLCRKHVSMLWQRKLIYLRMDGEWDEWRARLHVMRH